MTPVSITSHTAAPTVLIIYTGGTLGMRMDTTSGSLVPFDFSRVTDNMPEMARLKLSIDLISLSPLIDSANMTPSLWLSLAEMVRTNATRYHGFVIIHGTDTMAYTASALSYLLMGLGKPVILTGAQLPVGAPRTDARENLVTALEIAGALHAEGGAIIKEVCILFNNKLFRGNRATKTESVHFDAFQSPNYPALAEAGVKIEYNVSALYNDTDKITRAFKQAMFEHIVSFKLFPGLSTTYLSHVLAESNLKGVILETFGIGNVREDATLIHVLQTFIQKGGVILNISQCLSGPVQQDRYSAGRQLQEIGVCSGGDMTFEAAVTKMMFLLAQEETAEVSRLLITPLAGEMTI